MSKLKNEFLQNIALSKESLKYFKGGAQTKSACSTGTTYVYNPPRSDTDYCMCDGDADSVIVAIYNTSDNFSDYIFFDIEGGNEITNNSSS